MRLAYHRLSMSKLGLSTQCLYGMRPDVPSYDREPGRAAKLGTLVHAMVESAVLGTPMPTSDDPDLMAGAMAVWDGPLHRFIAEGTWTFCERGYVYDSTTDTTEDGPRRGEDGYGEVSTDRLYGTVDLVRVDGNSATVLDLKTGKPPADSEQLYGQAVAVARRYGLERVEVAYLRALKTKVQVLSPETLDADRLDFEAGRIRRRLRMLPTAEPQPGAWCWRCDARPGCPAQRSDEYVPPDWMVADEYEEGRRLF